MLGSESGDSGPDYSVQQAQIPTATATFCSQSSLTLQPADGPYDEDASEIQAVFLGSDGAIGVNLTGTMPETVLTSMQYQPIANTESNPQASPSPLPIVHLNCELFATSGTTTEVSPSASPSPFPSPSPSAMPSASPLPEPSPSSGPAVNLHTYRCTPVEGVSFGAYPEFEQAPTANAHLYQISGMTMSKLSMSGTQVESTLNWWLVNLQGGAACSNSDSNTEYSTVYTPNGVKIPAIWVIPVKL